jgi:hypothetical protein
MSTTPFTCGGSRKLLQRIGKRSPVAKHRMVPDGWYYGTRSITRHRPVWAMTSCCARGSAKRPGLRSNGSLKSEGAAMASYCQPRGHSGVRSMRKPAGQSACRPRCASSFRFKERSHRGSRTVGVLRSRRRPRPRKGSQARSRTRMRTKTKRKLNIER